MLRKRLLRFIQSEQGMALVTALVVTTLLSLAAATLFSTGTQEATKVEGHLENVQAFFVAEMGVEYAKNILRSWDKWYTWDPQLDAHAGTKTITLPNGDTAAFDIGFVYGVSGSMLTASGTYAGETRTVELTVDAQYDPIFVKALCACGGDADHPQEGTISINGNFSVDSYNSQSGAYAAQTPGNNGHIGGVADIDIGRGTINGNLEAEGNLTGNPNGLVTGDATVTGTVSSVQVTGSITEGHAFSKPVCDCNIDLPSAMADAQANNNNAAIPAWAWDSFDNNRLELNGNEVLTLDSGVYYLENLEMMGNSQIIINGEVVLYLYDQSYLELSGNSIINTDDNASNLRIYLYNDTTDGHVEIDGNATLSAAVYAPNAYVEMNGHGTVYGAIAGGTIEMGGNPSVHYDEDILTKIGDVPTDEVQMIVQNWHEL